MMSEYRHGNTYFDFTFSITYWNTPRTWYYYNLAFDRRSFGRNKNHFSSRKNKGPFSMAMGNVELVHECSPKHLIMGKAIIR